MSWLHKNQSSEILIKLSLSDSVQSHDKNKMKHDTSKIVSSLFKMTFNLRGSVDQGYSFIVKIYKKNNFSSEILIKFTFSDSVESHD